MAAGGELSTRSFSHLSTCRPASFSLQIFSSFQRVALFSAYAMSAMCRAGFDVIDVYPMTDSYPGGTTDEVHYPNHVLSTMETLLEKYKVENNKRVGQNEKKDRMKRCIE